MTTRESDRTSSILSFVSRAIVLVFSCLYLMFGCSSSEKPEPKIKSGAYLNQMFPVERETQPRPANKDDFYFKHCSQNFWRTVPTRNDYSCTEL